MKNIKRIFKDSEESFFVFIFFCFMCFLRLLCNMVFVKDHPSELISCRWRFIIGTDVDGGVLSTNESREMSTLAPTVVPSLLPITGGICPGLVNVGFVPIVAVTALTVGEFVEFFLVCVSGNLMEFFFKHIRDRR